LAEATVVGEGDVGVGDVGVGDVGVGEGDGLGEGLGDGVGCGDTLGAGRKRVLVGAGPDPPAGDEDLRPCGVEIKELQLPADRRQREQSLRVPQVVSIDVDA
jgi:hypothetical protein